MGTSGRGEPGWPRPGGVFHHTASRFGLPPRNCTLHGADVPLPDVAFLSSRLTARLSQAMGWLSARHDPPAEVHVSLAEVNFDVARDLDELFALRTGATETFLVRNSGHGTARSVTFRPRQTIASPDMAVFEAPTLPIAELTPGDCTAVAGQWSSGRCQPPYFVEVNWEDSRGVQRRTQYMSLPG